MDWTLSRPLSDSAVPPDPGNLWRALVVAADFSPVDGARPTSPRCVGADYPKPKLANVLPPLTLGLTRPVFPPCKKKTRYLPSL